MSNEMFEETSNKSSNREFEDVVNSYMSRRSLLVGSLAGAALTFVGARVASASASNGSSAKTASQVIAAKSPKIGFTSIPLQGTPMPTIAPEYTYSVLIPWREKLDGSGKSFEYAGFTAAQQEKSIGIGHDDATRQRCQWPAPLAQRAVRPLMRNGADHRVMVIGPVRDAEPRGIARRRAAPSTAGSSCA